MTLIARGQNCVEPNASEGGMVNTFRAPWRVIWQRGHSTPDFTKLSRGSFTGTTVHRDWHGTCKTCVTSSVTRSLECTEQHVCNHWALGGGRRGANLCH